MNELPRYKVLSVNNTHFCALTTGLKDLFSGYSGPIVRRDSTHKVTQHVSVVIVVVCMQTATPPPCPRCLIIADTYSSKCEIRNLVPDCWNMRIPSIADDKFSE
ncbi:hypothetical protein BaRGS_00023269 [Batillaria attramentaria]|uniref:Uncharacterized protein n=1 Tax=Batillaria attramentaria TaxID=370345 RepID=A0ABD0KEC4_9CAEN